MLIDWLSLHRHIRRLTSEHNAPMPTIDAAHRNLLTARALHNAQARTGTTQYPVLDWSAIVAGTRTAAGMNGLDTKKDVRRVSLIFSC